MRLKRPPFFSALKSGEKKCIDNIRRSKIKAMFVVESGEKKCIDNITPPYPGYEPAKAGEKVKKNELKK